MSLLDRLAYWADDANYDVLGTPTKTPMSEARILQGWIPDVANVAAQEANSYFNELAQRSQSALDSSLIRGLDPTSGQVIVTGMPPNVQYGGNPPSTNAWSTYLYTATSPDGFGAAWQSYDAGSGPGNIADGCHFILPRMKGRLMYARARVAARYVSGTALPTAGFKIGVWETLESTSGGLPDVGPITNGSYTEPAPASVAAYEASRTLQRDFTALPPGSETYLQEDRTYSIQIWGGDTTVATRYDYILGLPWVVIAPEYS